MSTWKALNNWVLIEIDNPKERTIGKHNLVVPDSSDKKFRSTGVIVSAGDTNRNPNFKPGVRVIFPPYGTGQHSTIDGKDYVSLLDWEIIGILKD